MKALLIIPYFGKLPNYFPLWVESAEQNKRIFDFLIITDQNIRVKAPNIRVEKTDFPTFKKFVQSKFDFHISLAKPYKLCDFRPAYGYIFNDDIKDDYDYWGFCDIDLIFGNAEKFLRPVWLKYDKISKLGHLQLYRNNSELKELFKHTTSNKTFNNYRKIFKRKGMYLFDEQFGIDDIANHSGIITLDLDCIADISPQHANFSVWHDYPDRKNYFIYKDGTITRFIEQESGYQKKEYLYLHLQKRPMIYNPNISLDNGFTIVPGQFINEIDTPERTFESMSLLSGGNTYYFQKKNQNKWEKLTSIYNLFHWFALQRVIKNYNKEDHSNIVKYSQLN
ncbi:DUF6625 family protein [Limosilactobacillus fermentum]|uniref:DUF6625 family protein n=1 Tax=Limosilactobacillus fermentum TaxID=1613 RepID=UPI00187FDE2F|nr:DUF6625 family protein [Limosilactobacillus fermentum]MBE8117622.1 hypothetical protein [Limosilactobacillus fermentum]MCL3985715.1 hypothetical protein [Limosilactobacillus fermentum]